MKPVPPGPAPQPAGIELDFDLASYLAKLRRHWLLIVLACVLALAAAVVRYKTTTPMYQATAQLQIERRSLNPLVSGASPWLENWWNLEYYPTQYRLLESRRTALDALELLIARGAIESEAAGAAGSDAEADSKALVTRADGLRGPLQVRPVRNTQLVDLVYRSPDPDFAYQAANAFAEAYKSWNERERRQVAIGASSFLGTQLEQLRSEIEAKEQELQAISEGTESIALDPESNVVLQRLDSENRDYSEAKGLRIAAQAKYNELLSAPPETLANSLSEGLVSQLRAELLAKEREYQSKLQTYKEDWPAMVELRVEIEKARENLDGVVDEMISNARREALADYQTALRRERALERELAGLRRTALAEQSAAVQYANTQMEISTLRDLFDQLLRRQSESAVTTSLQERGQAENVHIIEEAVRPGASYHPVLRSYLTFGLLAGLALGIGGVVVIEYLDRTIKTGEEAEQVLGLPTLAVIHDTSRPGKGYGYGGRYGSYGYGRKRDRPKDESGHEELKIELVPHTRPRLAISEAYRSLRTALLLSTADQLKVVTVTSAEVGEGKTTTAANLAVVMAQLGIQVLLIDADLRRPRQHELFKVSKRVGLVDYLTGRASWESCCLATEVPNLYLVPSGPLPPNPAELLSSAKMRELVAALRNKFGMVIIDTPPVFAVTDATVVGSRSDGLLLCLRAGKVSREEAKACRDRLLLSEIKILGTVLNRQRSSQGRYTRRYRSYEGYGEEEAVETTTDSAA